MYHEARAGEQTGAVSLGGGDGAGPGAGLGQIKTESGRPFGRRWRALAMRWWRA